MLTFWIFTTCLITLPITAMLILVSITLWMVVPGVWLKIRYQLHQGKAIINPPIADTF